MTPSTVTEHASSRPDGPGRKVERWDFRCDRSLARISSPPQPRPAGILRPPLPPSPLPPVRPCGVRRGRLLELLVPDCHNLVRQRTSGGSEARSNFEFVCMPRGPSPCRAIKEQRGRWRADTSR